MHHDDVIGESGKLYLAAILDLYSRFIVGWAVSAVNDRHLAIKALEMALKRRCPEAGLLHHSDQGCTYASEDYQRLLATRSIPCSMSRRGDCYGCRGELLLDCEDELADRFTALVKQDGAVRLHRSVLQPTAPSFDARAG